MGRTVSGAAVARPSRTTGVRGGAGDPHSGGVCSFEPSLGRGSVVARRWLVVWAFAANKSSLPGLTCSFGLEREKGVPYSGGSVHVRTSWGGIHHDTVHPGLDRGIAVNTGGAVGLFPENVCVSDVPSGFFDHVDVDPP